MWDIHNAPLAIKNAVFCNQVKMTVVMTTTGQLSKRFHALSAAFLLTKTVCVEHLADSNLA